MQQGQRKYVKPDFEFEDKKWYLHKELQTHIINEQENLPKLDNLYCFNVIGNNVDDIVLINNKQQVIKHYEKSPNYVAEDNMHTFITALKLNKAYDEQEIDL